MKIVINESFGGFKLSKKAAKLLGLKYPYTEGENPELIKLIEKRGSKFVSGEYSNLVLKLIPADATDYMVIDNAGYETLYYVRHGKIVRAN